MMPHMFSRTELLIGKAALDKLRASKVAIYGIGGVGSFVVEGLVRAGVGHFVLVDPDHICLSNLNRQLIATQRTIGMLKVEAARDRILEINPGAEVEIHPVSYGPEISVEVVRQDMDHIVDAMDTVAAKIDLILRAKALDIPVISCMGTGGKMDPTRFEVADIYQTSVCPLGRIIRRELKKRGVKSLKVVYSKEIPQKPRVSIRYEESDANFPAQRLFENKRARRPQASISFVPSAAGLIIASEVVLALIGDQEAKNG